MSSFIKAYYQMETFDDNFKTIKKTRVRRARSFVANFIKNVYTLMSGNSYSGYNSAGVVTALPVNNWYHVISRGLEYSSGGIQCGTSTQAVALTDYALISPISHGTDAGEFEAYGTWVTLPTIITSGTQEASFGIETIFHNNSGGSITVQEIGLYTTINVSFLMLRDLVSGGQIVNDGEWLKVKYTIKTTV